MHRAARLLVPARPLALALVAAAAAACSSQAAGTGPDAHDQGPGLDGGADATVAPVTCTGKAAQPLDATWTISSGGVDRTFDVHVPASYDPTRGTPVVLNFHGYSSNAAQENLLSEMDAKSDTAGFIAVHPQGTGVTPSWNAGVCCGEAAANGVDDVAFVNAMLDSLEATLCVDPSRVYATGMSNGGFMSHRLGCELADRIAAIAPVAGVLGVTTCAPSRPIAVMHFHGTADTLVPYDGNASMGFPSVPDTFAGWAQRDGCTGDPTQTYAQGDTTCQTYAQCDGGVEVTLCTVDGGGHTWPGGVPVPSLGKTTTDISATDAMWTFFQAHPKP